MDVCRKLGGTTEQLRQPSSLVGAGAVFVPAALPWQTTLCHTSKIKERNIYAMDRSE